MLYKQSKSLHGGKSFKMIEILFLSGDIWSCVSMISIKTYTCFYLFFFNFQCGPFSSLLDSL